VAKSISRTPSRHTLDETSGRLRRRSASKQPYKVVAVGLYDDQARSLDWAASHLQAAGLNQANRSFLVQALVRRFQQDTAGMTPEEVLTLFVDHYLRRSLAHAPARSADTPTGASSKPSAQRPRAHAASRRTVR